MHYLGLDDVGLLTVNALLRAIKPMCESTNIPLIVDADTGFGGYHVGGADFPQALRPLSGKTNGEGREDDRASERRR